MKKVIVIGASGSLAREVINTSKRAKNTELTLFVRNKKRLSQGDAEQYRVIEGDALNYQDVKNAVAGQDIVYVNLAGDLRSMGENIVRAMKESGVKRIIAICSIGIYEQPMKSVLTPYRALADVVEVSGLDYTILRPDWFTSSNEVNYALTRKGNPEAGSAISRKSIADFVVTLFENPDSYVNENLGISKPD